MTPPPNFVITILNEEGSLVETRERGKGKAGEGREWGEWNRKVCKGRGVR